MQRIVILLAFLSASSFAVAQSKLVGEVTQVRDGDTIEIGETAIRLDGLSAPERNEPFGAKATAYMRTLVEGKVLVCDLDGTRSYDRMIGICYLEGKDIASLIVRAGLARDCPRYSGGRYRLDEEEAQNTGIAAAYALPSYCY